MAWAAAALPGPGRPTTAQSRSLQGAEGHCQRLWNPPPPSEPTGRLRPVGAAPGPEAGTVPPADRWQATLAWGGGSTAAVHGGGGGGARARVLPRPVLLPDSGSHGAAAAAAATIMTTEALRGRPRSRSESGPGGRGDFKFRDRNRDSCRPGPTRTRAVTVAGTAARALTPRQTVGRSESESAAGLGWSAGLCQGDRDWHPGRPA